MEEALFYRCDRCGNIVALIKRGGGTLVCCGQTLTELVANSTEAAKEKHIPVVTKEAGKIKVSVGSVEHPMTEAHFIEWIALVSGNNIQIVRLTAGMKPTAEFAEFENGTVYAYCNIHGLWKAEF